MIVRNGLTVGGADPRHVVQHGQERLLALVVGRPDGGAEARLDRGAVGAQGNLLGGGFSDEVELGLDVAPHDAEHLREHDPPAGLVAELQIVGDLGGDVEDRALQPVRLVVRVAVVDGALALALRADLDPRRVSSTA